jgi:hypothetical protein
MSTRNARPLSRRAKKAFAIVGIAGILLVAAPLWWRSRNTIPDVQHLTRKLPQPNAYTHYVSAGQKIRHEQVIYYATRTYPPNHRPTLYTNGYFKNGSKYDIRTKKWVKPLGNPLDFSYSLAKKERILLQNSEALKILRQGLKYEYWQPVGELSYSVYSSWRPLAYALHLEAQVHTAYKRHAQAAQSAIDCIRFGTHIMHGGTTPTFAYASLIRSRGRKALSEVFVHLDAQTCRQVIQQLEEIYKNRPKLSEGFEQDKIFYLNLMTETIRNEAQWRSMLEPYDDVYHGYRKSSKESVSQWMRRLTISPSEVTKLYTDYMDNLIVQSKKTYAEAIAACDSPKNTLLYNWSLANDSSVLHYAVNQTQDVFLLTRIALHAHKLEYNAYPKSLNELTPRYLKTIPLDPFADNQPLQYKRVGNEYSLYSVGPDCVDNNGRAIDSKIPVKTAYDKRQRYRVEQNSRGDIVAGVNIG